MWWSDEAFNKAYTDRDGSTWHFKVWSDILSPSQLQCIFFWNTDQTQTGLIEYRDNQILHRRRLQDKILKIVSDQSFREKYCIPLKFPIEKNYLT